MSQRKIFLFLITFFLLLFNSHSAFATIQFNIDNAVPLDTEINLTASISGLTTSSCSSEGKCYFQGTLRRIGSSYYFGQTQNNSGSWIDYISSPELEYIQSTFYSFQPNSGSWYGQLKMRFSVEDTEYKGPGDYELKVRRFSGNSKNPSGESNLLSLALTATLPTPTPTLTPTPTPSVTPTPDPTSTSTPTSSPSPKPTATSTPTSTLKLTPTKTPTPTKATDKISSLSAQIFSASVAGVAIERKNDKKGLNPLLILPIILSIFFLAVSIFLFYHNAHEVQNEKQ